MTGSLRSTARNPIAIALMGLLILVFLILGVGGGSRFPDAFRSIRADSVVSAGAHSTSSRDFRRIFEAQKTKFEQQTSQQLTNEFLAQNGADQQILNQIALDQAELEMLQRAGVTPSPALVDTFIKQIPGAFDKVTGKFSESQFTQLLASQGLTVRDAQSQITDDLAERQFAYALGAGYKVPRLYAAVDAVAGLESRDVSYFVLGVDAVPPPAPPTDAQLQAFIKEHAAQLMRPEMRVITLARFSAKALSPGVTIDPADVAKEFAFKKDSLSSPELRTVIQIPVKSQADGAQAAARLSQGENPAAIAKSLGSEPVTYVDKPQSAIADPKLATAAFALKEGAATGPVAGSLGLAALKVVKVTPGSAATLESARPQIEAELRQKKAADQAYELSQKFDDARQAGAGVVDAARKAGVATQTIGPVAANGSGSDGKPNPLLDEKVLKAAFAQTAGQDGDVTDAGPGEYFAVRVERIIPPSLPPVTENRDALARAYMNMELVQSVKAKADQLIGQIKKGLSLEQAAAQVGAHVVHQTGMQRIKAQQYQGLGREFLQSIFGVKPGEVFAAGGQNGIFIAKLDAVRPGDPAMTARLLEAIRGRVSQGYAGDLMATVQAAARNQIKPSVNLTLARQAIGVDPAITAKPGPGGAAKPK